MKIDAYLSESSLDELYHMFKSDSFDEFFFRSGLGGFQSPYIRENGTIGKGFWITGFDLRRQKTIHRIPNEFKGRIVDIRFNHEDGKLHVELEDGWLIFNIIDENHREVSRPGKTWPEGYAWRRDHE